VLYVGGLMAGRGLEQLVDAMPHVEGGVLVFLGDGVLAASLRQRAAAAGIADRVRVIPPVPSSEVIDVAASADVGVSPIVPSCLNYRYSLPNKLFQYMAAGLAVVASDFPQVREVVQGAACGLVVDTRRPTAIAEAINRLLRDPDEARAMGERGRRAVIDRFNWTTSAEALLDVYARLTR
jgi:glycosyltransferase involved in cell wall biosynthesis